MNDQSLINKYRPVSFAEVIGNAAVVRTLQEAVALESRHHAYLLSGPAGTGKTSLARIIASILVASVEEIDAASNSGVDDTRMLVTMSGFQPILGGASSRKMLIIDECHSLSKNAWQPLLKLIEEPPSYMYFGLATTELNKVPEAIRTRCHHVPLKPCAPNEIADWLTIICEIENWTVNNDVFNGIVKASTGQPRKALSILQAGHSTTSLQELAEVVSAVEIDNMPMLELCKFLTDGGKDWPKVSKMLSQIEDDEEAWASGCRWLANRIINSEDAKSRHYHKLLQAMVFPRNTFDRKAQLVSAVCDFLWG